jgi:hypothetical protein
VVRANVEPAVGPSWAEARRKSRRALVADQTLPVNRGMAVAGQPLPVRVVVGQTLPVRVVVGQTPPVQVVEDRRVWPWAEEAQRRSGRRLSP